MTAVCLTERNSDLMCCSKAALEAEWNTCTSLHNMETLFRLELFWCIYYFFSLARRKRHLKGRRKRENELLFLSLQMKGVNLRGTWTLWLMNIIILLWKISFGISKVLTLMWLKLTLMKVKHCSESRNSIQKRRGKWSYTAVWV